MNNALPTLSSTLAATALMELMPELTKLTSLLRFDLALTANGAADVQLQTKYQFHGTSLTATTYVRGTELQEYLTMMIQSSLLRLEAANVDVTELMAKYKEDAEKFLQAANSNPT